MREIKFRAWDKEKQDMLPVTSIDWRESWVSCEPVLPYKLKPLEYGDRNSFKNEDTDRHILMQYTGLHDKNGREIYEGDIVTRENVKPLSAAVLNALGRPPEQPKTQNEVVVWLQGEAGFYGECCGSHTTPNYKSLINAHVALEVIGDVHEHPELLEVE